MKPILLLCILHFTLFSATIVDSVRISHSGKATLTRTVHCGDSSAVAFYFGEDAKGTIACSTKLAQTFTSVTVQNNTVTAKRTYAPKDRKQFLYGDANELAFNLMNFLELPEMNLVELTSFKRLTSDNQEDLIAYAEKCAAGKGWELVVTPPSVPIRVWGNPNRTKLRTIQVELLSEQDVEEYSITWNRIPPITLALVYLLFVMFMFSLIGKMHKAHRDSHS